MAPMFNIVTRANALVFSNWSDNINRYLLIGAFHLKAHLTPATHLVNNPWTWFHYYFLKENHTPRYNFGNIHRFWSESILKKKYADIK